MTGAVRRLAMGGALALAGTAAAAAAVSVRSGEHATFSRLVFSDVAGRQWQVERKGREAVIVFSEGSPELDLDRVFDLIPRDRIVSASAGNGRLTLGLGCDCPVAVSQIPTGHIVIDVSDDPLRIAPVPRHGPVQDASLPIVLPPLEMAFAPRLLAAMEVASGPGRPLALEGPSQIRRHPAGTARALLPHTPERSKADHPSGCAFEGLAAEVLAADPREALGRVPQGMASLLDGGDRLDPAAAASLARLYLAAGFGAEAVRVTALTSGASESVRVVAAALDGASYPAGMSLDPACGPATAVLALLNTDQAIDWARADETEFAWFVDAMHPTTSANLVPRLRTRLTELGHPEALEAIMLAPGTEVPDQPPQELVAAGTDEAAVQAAIVLLDEANAALQPSKEIHLVNASALRPSLPPGPLRRSLEESLARALVLSQRPVEAVALVREGVADGETLLTLALDALPPEAMAELAVRLRQHVAPGGDAATRAADFFLAFGLEDSANAFAAPSGNAPEAVDVPSLLSDPWLRRDMAAMLEAEPDSWTPRHRLAEDVLARRAAISPETGLAAAGAVIEGSRRTAALVADLLAAEDTR